MFSEILIGLVKKMRLKGPSAKWRPFCLALNVLKELTHLIYKNTTRKPPNTSLDSLP